MQHPVLFMPTQSRRHRKIRSEQRSSKIVDGIVCCRFHDFVANPNHAQK